MGRRIDLTGQKFGRLTVLGYDGQSACGKAAWSCRCDCGNHKRAISQHLRSGSCKSCGCFNRDRARERATSHGMCKTAEYNAWVLMLRRCRDATGPDAKHYLGRGISVCERWDLFENFFADMGKKPSPNHSLDRIDNDGDYEPGNCRWATQVTQTRNRRSTLKIEWNGCVACAEEWAERTGLPARVIRKRLSRLGWSVEKALTTPTRKGGPRKTIVGTREGWRIRFCGV